MTTLTRHSTLGRPRRVTDTQIAEILAWYATRRTNREKARELGISVETLQIIVRHGGRHYKQPSPEHRATNQHSVTERRNKLRKDGYL